jgi:hypothetical protein
MLCAEKAEMRQTDKTNTYTPYEVNEVHKVNGLFKVVFCLFSSHNGKIGRFFNLFISEWMNSMNICELYEIEAAFCPVGNKSTGRGCELCVNFKNGSSHRSFQFDFLRL